MNDDAAEDLVPAPVRGLLELFHEELSAVKFPHLDATVLEGAVGEVKVRAEELARAEEAVAAARKVMHDAQEALAQKAARALAYARVYAEEDPALLAKIDGLGTIRSNRRPQRTEVEASASGAQGAPRRRGRPPKVRATESLFVDENGMPLNGVIDRERTMEA